VALAARLVAAELGNTPAICRASYVHPLVIARYVDAGVTITAGAEPARAAVRRKTTEHTPEERALLAFLDRYFPDRRRRDARHPRERREEMLAA
jgi:DNA topoisomerase-1